MDERLLGCFVKVYELGSIHKAAEKIFVTPQAVSKMIKKLEDELGRSLFARSPHGLQPTVYAHKLHDIRRSKISDAAICY